MILRSIQRAAIAAATLAALCSCSVMHKIEFEVMVPSDTLIQLGAREISLVNAVDISQKTDPAKRTLDSLVASECVRAAWMSLGESGKYQFGRVDTLPTATPCRGPRIEIDMADISPRVVRKPFVDIYTGLYNAVMEVRFQIGWSMYDAAGARVYGLRLADTVWIEGAKPSYHDIYDLVDFERVVDYVVRQSSTAIASKAAPFWRRTYRYIYGSGNDDMTVAGQCAYHDEWDEARELWLRNASSTNRELAGKANYNLAVMCEKEGLLLQALEYAQTAVDRCRFKPAAELSGVLRKRLESIADIEAQMQE